MESYNFSVTFGDTTIIYIKEKKKTLSTKILLVHATEYFFGCYQFRMRRNSPINWLIWNQFELFDSSPLTFFGFWFLTPDPFGKAQIETLNSSKPFTVLLVSIAYDHFGHFMVFICVVFLHDKKFSLVFLKSQRFSWNKSWCDCHCTNVETEAEEVTVSPEKKDVLYFFLSVSYTSHPGKENYNPKEWHYCKYSFHYFLCGFNSYLTKQLEKADSRHTNQTNE